MVLNPPLPHVNAMAATTQASEKEVETKTPEILDENTQESPSLKSVSSSPTSSPAVSSDSQELEKDSQRLEELEGLISKSFKNADRELKQTARYLKEIKDRHLYKVKDYTTWKDYVEAKFPFTRRYADYQITYVEVFDVVAEQNEEHSVPLPTNEAQTRALAGLLPEEKAELWIDGCQRSSGKVPKRKTMAELARTYKAEKEQQKLATLPAKDKSKKRRKTPQIKKNDYVYILKVNRDEDRAYQGYWGLVSEVSDLEDSTAIQYRITLPQGEVTLVDRFPDVPSEATVKKISLKGAQRKSWTDLHEKLARVYQNLSDNSKDKNYKEPVVSTLIEYFGRHKQELSITSLESDLLSTLEEKFKLIDKKPNTDREEDDTREKQQSFQAETEVKTKESEESNKEVEKSELATAITESSINASPEDHDLRKLYATWRTRQEFAELTGISEYQLRKLFNTKEFKENKTLGYATHYKLPIEIDRSGNAYKYRVNCDGLLTYSELIEKHPELADFKKFTKEARLKDRKIKRLNFLNNRKLESEYLLYQYIFDKSTGLFKIEIFQKKNRKS